MCFSSLVFSKGTTLWQVFMCSSVQVFMFLNTRIRKHMNTLTLEHKKTYFPL